MISWKFKLRYCVMSSVSSFRAGQVPSPERLRSHMNMEDISSFRDGLQIYLSSGNSVDKRVFKRGETLLHLAAREPSAEFIQALIEAGANIEVLNDQNKTPLYQALFYQVIPSLEALLNAGAKFSDEDASYIISALVQVGNESEGKKIQDLLNQHKISRIALPIFIGMKAQSNSTALERAAHHELFEPEFLREVFDFLRLDATTRPCKQKKPEISE